MTDDKNLVTATTDNHDSHFWNFLKSCLIRCRQNCQCLTHEWNRVFAWAPLYTLEEWSASVLSQFGHGAPSSVPHKYNTRLQQTPQDPLSIQMLQVNLSARHQRGVRVLLITGQSAAALLADTIWSSSPADIEARSEGCFRFGLR